MQNNKKKESWKGIYRIVCVCVLKVQNIYMYASSITYAALADYVDSTVYICIYYKYKNREESWAQEN